MSCVACVHDTCSHRQRRRRHMRVSMTCMHAVCVIMSLLGRLRHVETEEKIAAWTAKPITKEGERERRQKYSNIKAGKRVEKKACPWGGESRRAWMVLILLVFHMHMVMFACIVCMHSVLHECSDMMRCHVMSTCIDITLHVYIHSRL